MVIPAQVGRDSVARSALKAVSEGHRHVLLFEAGGRHCAMPLGPVRETMRELPVEPLAGVPRFVRGLAMMRGAAVPVLDVAMLLGADAQVVERFISIVAGERSLALAVGAVRGVFAMPDEALQAMPPLLAQADVPAIEALAVADDSLWTVLGAARLLPASAWALIDAAASPAEAPPS